MSHDTLQSVGLEVARLRRERGLTQAQLSERSGIARSTIARLEVGQLSDFGVRKLLTLLASMGCALNVVDNDQPLTLDDVARERGANLVRR